MTAVAEIFHHPEQYDLSLDEYGEPYEPGWYYWFVQPGCLPDSQAFGPFESYDAAWKDARAEEADRAYADEAATYHDCEDIDHDPL